MGRRFDPDHRLRSRRSYTALLERILGFYRPLEERLAEFAVRAYAPATGARWRAFGTAVETLVGGVPTPATWAAAMAAYSGLDAWLCDDQW